jgi:hypothetical protein
MIFPALLPLLRAGRVTNGLPNVTLGILRVAAEQRGRLVTVRRHVVGLIILILGLLFQ